MFPIGDDNNVWLKLNKAPSSASCSRTAAMRLSSMLRGCGLPRTGPSQTGSNEGSRRSATACSFAVVGTSLAP